MIQPVGKVYVITGLPANTPVTTPLTDPTVACAGVPIVHVPVVGLDDKVLETPVHNTKTPVIALGNALTVIPVVAIQPEGNVYVITGKPAVRPVTTPPLVIVASDVLLLVQLPPDVPSLSNVEEPTQTFIVPVIAAGRGLTE